MFKNKRAVYLLFYIVISLLFMEFLFRGLTTKALFSINFITTILLTITIAAFLFFFISLFRGKTRTILSTISLLFFAIIFSSQLVYYEFFKAYYSLYSAGNASQVLDFAKDIWTITLNNSFWILLYFLPAILLPFIGRFIFSNTKLTRFARVAVVLTVFMAYGASMGSIYLHGKEQHSAYDLYFNARLPIISVEKLGLLTTMRLDFQRQISGWSPKLNIENPYETVTASPIEKDTEEKVDETTEKPIEQKQPEKVKVKYNTMDIPFQDLIEAEQNEEILAMHHYFKSVPPTAKNEFTGKYKDYNLIFITAESFSPYAVDPVVTPTLYKLVNKGYKFTNFYNPMWDVSTTDGEYVATTGLIPKSGVWSMAESANNYMPFAMGNQLKQLGYTTVAYHNHTYTYYERHLSHPNLGYTYKGLGNGLQVRESWPESDLEMMQVTIPEYIDKEPFHAYYMTVSGHMQYSFDGNVMARKNKEYVDQLPLSNQGKAYIATHVELDRALKHLLNQLKEKGILDHTLIVLSADHYPYGLEKETIDELAGHTVEENFELYRSPFILYTEEMEPKTVTKPVSSLDIIPTISNLLGLEYDSRLLMGQDIFSDAEPLVIFLNKSFITDKGKYNALTDEFIPTNGPSVDQAYIDKMKAIVDSKFYYSAKILEKDYYSKVLE